MTESRRPGGGRRTLALAKAEFLKIWASRIPLGFLVATPVLTCVFVLELYHVEGLAERLPAHTALDALPVLYFATVKTMLFHGSVLAFAAFWSTVDSQYGMIRVACAQPLSRVEYLIGKWCGIGAHVILFAAALVLSQLGWTAAYSGLRGVDASAWAAVARFSAEVALFALALAVVAMAAASVRRTVGAGLVTAVLAIVALAMMVMVPFRVLSPRLVLMRYFFFPLGEFPNPFPLQPDSPFVRVHSLLDFVLVATATPLLAALPALVCFARRDITE